MTTDHTCGRHAPLILIRLAFFKDFPTVAGLIRETGARRIGSRDFVLDGPMELGQVAALIELQHHSRNQESGNPVTVTVEPPLDNNRRFAAMQNELYDWWGTVDQPNWQ